MPSVVSAATCSLVMFSVVMLVRPKMWLMPRYRVVGTSAFLGRTIHNDLWIIYHLVFLGHLGESTHSVHIIVHI